MEVLNEVTEKTNCPVCGEPATNTDERVLYCPHCDLTWENVTVEL